MMKKRLIAIGFILLLSSCAQKEGAPVQGGAQPGATVSSTVHGSMNATIDGNKWSAEGTPSEQSLENVTATIDSRTGYLTITGHRDVQHAVTADVTDAIQLTIKDIAPGNYALAPDFNNVQTGTYLRGTDTSEVYFIQEGQTGQVTVTRVDTAVSRIFGTFRFEARNAKGKSIKIEEGAFDNVKYQ